MSSSSFLSRVNIFTGIIGLATGVLLLPAVFSLTLAIGEVSAEGKIFLCILSLLVFGWSSVLLLLRTKLRSAVPALLFLSLLMILTLEFAARLGVKVFASEETKNNFIMQSEMSRGLSMAYEGHPFTQFTGRKNIGLKGTPYFGKLQPFNNFGFPDVDFDYAKPENVIRIACIGESTTADGYPAFLEKILNENRAEQNTRYETMCFAHAMWTTEHTMISFLTNIVDFKPDYLVIHHGWNEAKVRNCPPGQFCNDYSHHFKSFEKPEVYDGVLIRASIIYRWLKFQFDKTPQWMNMGGAVEKDREHSALDFSDTTELKPYRRNLETIITMAKFYGIKVVMTTLPHSTDSTIEFYYSVPNIEQCNTINRQLAEKYKSEILFADIDEKMTGKQNALFNDLGHTEPKGLKMKAEIIAPLILESSKEVEKKISHLPVEICRQEHLYRIQQRIQFEKNSTSENQTPEQKARNVYSTDSLKRIKAL